MLDTLTFCLNVAICAGVCTYSAVYFIHMLQLESYQIDGYFRWLHRRVKQGMLPLAVAIPAGVLCAAAWFLARNPVVRLWLTAGYLIAFCAMAWGFLRYMRRMPVKKKVVYTPRVKRLISALGFLHTILTVAFGPVAFGLIALTVPLAAWIMQPIEKRINMHYFNDAKRIIDGRRDLIKIGITGSYGKTSVKFILSSMLAERYRVLTPPSSFNTPMGLTRVIREQLKPTHQVLLAEMGARHVGDIQELCNLVHPQYGVLTSIGPQHLDTFGDVETVARTKNELIEALPKDGVAFFGSGGVFLDALYAQARCEKYLAGVDLRAEEVTVGAQGSDFMLVEGDKRARCHTRLLGMHNIQNLVLCACVARRLGLSMEEIARGISRVKPVEHRLALLSSMGGITIIDDAFNASPVGTKAALAVLKAFAPARRIIVTPGLVELGEKGDVYNREFGRAIAEAADFAILVGGEKRAEPIRAGLIEAGYAPGNIRVAEHLNAATAILREIGAAGDVVLFENDLPDNYS